MSKIKSVFSISGGRKFLVSGKSGKFLKPGFTVLLSVISLTAIALAGSLTPPAAPASTFHTLEELYNSVAGTFDSSSITSSTTGSLIQGIKYINSNLAWASGSNNIWNLNTGKVGIGTTAPTTKLEVQGTASASYLLTGNTLQVGGYSSAAYSRFGTTTTGHSLSANNDLLISGLLEVDGTAYFDGTVNFTGTASASLFYAGNGTTASPSFSFRADQDTGMYRKDTNSVSISAGSLERLNLTPTTASISNALYVNSTGKVGVGTTTPGEKLDVVGNIQNITNTDAPLTRAGALELPSGDAYTYDIAVSGRYAYITTYLDPARVIVVDVSKPSSPTKIGSVTLNTGENYSHGIATAGRYVYVTGWGSPGKLITVDVSNPASPTRVGAVTLETGENNPYSVAVAGRYAYVSTYTSPAKIIVIDVSNPASPTRVGAVTLNTNENNSQIVVSGRYVYATTFTSPARVIVIDVSNPASPTRVGAVTLNTGEANAQIAVAGRYAYVSTWTAPAQLVVVDISNPTAPTRISSMTFPTGENSALSIDVAGRYAYMSTETVPGKVLVADVSNPSSPVRAGVLSFSGLENTAQAVAVAGRYAYAVTYTSPGNLIAVDITGFETTALMAHSAEVGGLQVRNSATIENNLSVRGGLTVGINGIFSQGPLSVRGGSVGAALSLLDIRNASGSSIFLARDDSKVGIGTSAPSTMFEVQGTASASYGLFGTLQAAGFSSTSYSRFGTNTTGYSSFLSSANDLLISGDLEVDGNAFFDNNASVSNKFEVYNTTGTASLEFFSNNNADKRFTVQSVLNNFGGGLGSAGDRLSFRNSLNTELFSIASDGDLFIGIGSTGKGIILPPASYIAGRADGDFRGTTATASFSEGYIKFAQGSDPVMKIDAGENNSLYIRTDSLIRFNANNFAFMPDLSGGNVGIGTTTPLQELHIASASDGNLFRLQDSDGTCDQNPEAGAITTTCSSDARLKDNITDAAPILQRFVDLKIRDYIVKSSGDHMTGVIAQELQQTWPELVASGSDGFLMASQPSTWQIIKALQEQQAQITEIASKSSPADESFLNFIASLFEKVFGIVFKNGLVQSIKGVFGIVETDRLCVGNTCVTEKELIDLLQRANVPQAVPTVLPTPTPTPTDTPIPYVDPTLTPSATPTPVTSETPTTSPVETLPTVSPTPTPDLNPTPTSTPTPTPIISTPEPTPVVSEPPITTPVEVIPSP